MRRLILAVALFVTSLAFAHDHEEKHIHAKYFDNNVGGKTIITDSTKWCGNVGGHDGYAYSAAGDKIRFCWTIRSDMVLVRFEGESETGMWPAAVFQDMPHGTEPDVDTMFPVNPKDL